MMCVYIREGRWYFLFFLDSPNVENACWNDVLMKSWSVTSPENTSFLGPVHWLSVSLNFSSRRAIKTTFQPAFDRAMADARPIPKRIDLIIHLDFFSLSSYWRRRIYKPEDAPVIMAVLLAISRFSIRFDLNSFSLEKDLTDRRWDTMTLWRLLVSRSLALIKTIKGAYLCVCRHSMDDFP